MRNLLTALIAVAAVAACGAPAPPSPPPAAPATTTTAPSGAEPEPPTAPPEPAAPEPEPPPARAVSLPPVPPEPPELAAVAADGEECHPAYVPCLPVLDGDGLDCSDIPRDVWPVGIWNPADDPYQLGDGESVLGCRPHLEPTPAVEPAPADEPQSEEPQEPADVDPPVTEPSAVPPPAVDPEPAPAPPVGDPGEPTVTTTTEPEGPQDPPEPGTPTPPPAEPESTPEPPPTPPTETDPPPPQPDVAREVPCVDVPAHDGERWCTPPPVGDTIQLFSDWGAMGGPDQSFGRTRCGYDGYDWESYIDSPVDYINYDDYPSDGSRRVCRTLPLELRVGQVIEDYNINGRKYNVHTILEIGEEPWERLPIWTDVVYPVITCSRPWIVVDGHEELGFIPGPKTHETLYIAWPTDDGRWRLLLDPGMSVLSSGC